MKKARNILVVTLMIVSVLSFGSVANTYAKYTSSAELSDTAKVAKWDVRLGNEYFWSTNATKTVDLFTDNVIAPGSYGSFAIKDLGAIRNYSEVAANFSIKMQAKVLNAPTVAVPGGEAITITIPLQYCTSGCTNDDNWSTDIAEIKANNVAGDPTNGTEVKFNSSTIYWRWDPNSSDISDTQLGIAATTAANEDAKPQVKLTAVITAEQATN